MSGQAILVWSGPVDPSFIQQGYLRSALAQMNADVDQQLSAGVVLLKQTVEQMQARPALYTGWKLYEQGAKEP